MEMLERKIREGKLSRRDVVKFGGLGFIGLTLFGCGGGSDSNSINTQENNNNSGSINSYSVEQVDINGVKEYRLKTQGHHFMSLIDDRGTFNLRPHPGEDPNGWGSSLYFQPFLPGALLSHSVLEEIQASDSGIRVSVLGAVSRSQNSSYGNWNANFDITYDSNAKKVSAAGNYSISLTGLLSNSTGDLNLYKLASNYLYDVPLLSGGRGDTGDMSVARVSGDGFNFEWIPDKEPAFFPGNRTANLSVDVVGNYNQVDTVAQGYQRIEPAQKPSCKVTLNSQTSGIPMIFGAMYEVSKRKIVQAFKGQDFWEDNVGITPLIVKDSSFKDYNFKVTFESTP